LISMFFTLPSPHPLSTVISGSHQRNTRIEFSTYIKWLTSTLFPQPFAMLSTVKLILRLDFACESLAYGDRASSMRVRQIPGIFFFSFIL
jgi:hypothetical protein